MSDTLAMVVALYVVVSASLALCALTVMALYRHDDSPDTMASAWRVFVRSPAWLWVVVMYVVRAAMDAKREAEWERRRR